MKIEIPISHGHDYFTVYRDNDQGEVRIELWSRGTFSITISLSFADAEAFARALSATKGKAS